MISPRDVLPVDASLASSMPHGSVDTGWKALVLFASLATLVGCTRGLGFEDPKAAVAEVLESPGVAPRLSVARTFRACTESAPADGTITRARCPALRPSDERRLADLAAPLVGAKDDPDALQSLALVELVAGDSTGRALDRAISNLRRAAELADRPAPVLADLAAALVIRAERTQAPRDLLEAYETAEQAVDREPLNPAALYNRALALDRFGLVDEVARDWQAFLAVDSTSGWADEARRRRRDLLALRPPPAPADDAPLAEYARYAAADPQGARELGMDRLLGEWGQAVEAGDAARADDRLRRAAALGEALARRPGGDASLADAVHAIRAGTADPAATRTLPRAHREYAAGQRYIAEADYARADTAFTAAALSDASAVLRDWANAFHAGAAILTGHTASGEQRLRGVLARADSTRHPALLARVGWSLGSVLNRTERWEQALPQGLRAAALFADLGEGENGAGSLHVVIDARFVLGEPDSGYTALHDAQHRVRRRRGSMRLHNLLITTARTAAEDGFARAAIRLQNEGVLVAERTGRPLYAVEAHLARARLLAASGQTARAETDLQSARTVIRGIRNTDQRRFLLADLRITEALALYASTPERSSASLDSAAAFFHRRIPFRALPALVAGAQARMALGDTAGATRRLETAVRLLEQRRDSVRVEARRAAVFNAARAALDRIVMLRLREGRVTEALESMDRGRASLAFVGTGPPGSLRAAAPAGEVLLEYALVGDTLLAWTVAGTSVEVTRTVIDTVHFKRTLSALDSRLERGVGTVELESSLSWLYDQLIRPVATRLGPREQPVVVVADGLLAAVPFPALRDSRREQYLLEAHPLRFATSMREARRSRMRGPATSVLLVADPAFDPGAYPLLDPLPNARDEVRHIASAYPRSRLLEGARATPDALMAALPHADVVHFAGHAVFDDARPERSYLVLAPARGDRGGVSAGELARMDLRHIRLMILSACRTVRVGTGRADGFTGLAGALLTAGVGGVVGSTWDVGDRATGTLMSEFHRAYRRVPDGPRALRAAQLALLRSQDDALRSPAVWAGFRYSGQ